MSDKKQRIGTRAQVWHETALQTPGGLKKGSLIMNKNGRIVSRSKHNTAKKEMRLLKYGYGTKKGKFGFVKTGSKYKSKSKSKSRSKSRKTKRGGASPLSPETLSGPHSLTGGSGMGTLYPAPFHGDKEGFII